MDEGMTIWTSSPEWRARGTKIARKLREFYKLSYEEIATDMLDRNDAIMAPWEVYALVNPSKSEEQVARWKARHYPGE